MDPTRKDGSAGTPACEAGQRERPGVGADVSDRETEVDVHVPCLRGAQSSTKNRVRSVERFRRAHSLWYSSRNPHPTFFTALAPAGGI